MPLNLLRDYPKQGQTLSTSERVSVRAENSSCTTFKWIARCKEKKMAYSMPFLYGNHVSKAHLGRIAEDTPEHQGVVMYSMDDTPLVRWVIPWEVVRLFTMIGLWCHWPVDGWYSKDRSNIHRCLSSSVSTHTAYVQRQFSAKKICQWCRRILARQGS